MIIAPEADDDPTFAQTMSTRCVPRTTRSSCSKALRAESLNAIEVYVSRLRAKLEPAGVHIRTVRGFGYMLERRGNRRSDSKVAEAA